MAWFHQVHQISSGTVASKRPKGKSCMHFEEAIKDPLLQAKFKFVEFISQKLNLFIGGFQTYQPMVPFLSDTSKEILVSLMNMFILKETMVKADTIVKVMMLML